MIESRLHSARTLSLTIALLAIAQSMGGLFFAGTYNDNAWGACAFRGNDLITAVIAIPMLLTAVYFSGSGSMRHGWSGWRHCFTCCTTTGSICSVRR